MDYTAASPWGATVAWILIAALSLIVVTLLVMARALNRIDTRLNGLKAQGVSAEHDVLTPVFSAQQLQLARQRFATVYQRQQRLEQELYESPIWAARMGNTVPSPALVGQMRRVCEALVDSESAWQEYEFMIEGNLRVAHRGERGRQVVLEWKSLLRSTRGVAALDFVSPNAAKVQRVDTWLSDWTARLTESDPSARMPMEDALFREVWEDREHWGVPH